MQNYKKNASDQPLLSPSFAPEFLDDHARSIINDPKTALVELVANCWDAGADRVDIQWPEVSRPETIRVSDNGTGMSYHEFIERWPQLKYNRRRHQGDYVQFPPDNQSSRRKAFGRNGKGRHSMFCFSNIYWVETWRDGECNLFEVQRSSSIASTPFSINRVSSERRNGHGTTIFTELERNHIKLDVVRNLVGSKFITDPSFRVFINNEALELEGLEHLVDKREILVPSVGSVWVSQVDTQQTSRTSRPHGVAWWVNKRLVGEPSWQDFAATGYLDRRTVEAKRYTFVVEADVLEDDVEEDWNGFHRTDQYRKVYTRVEAHIRMRLRDLLRDEHKLQKRLALQENWKEITGLPAASQYFIGQAVDGIQDRLPTVKQRVVSTTVSVLSKLEKTRTGYDILDQLSRLKLDEIDALSELLQTWSVHEVRVVLNELERRLKIIERLEQFIEDPTTDELHELQPLFEQGLWIFGPEFESIQFTSNRTLSKVIRDLLGDTAPVQLSNPRRRPDFVILPDSSIGVYSSDSFDEQSEVNGYEKILVVELKRGGSRITYEELNQGNSYARELRNSGKVQRSTRITVLVLGTEISGDVVEPLEQGNTTTSARTYSVVLKQAHARTFHLHRKLKEVRDLDLADPEVEAIMNAPVQSEWQLQEGQSDYAYSLEAERS